MKALVLCAGYGTRLGELTRETPKPLLPLAGEPLLGHTLRWLAAQGFRDVAINLHYRPESIRDYVGDGAAFGARVIYSQEPALLGTAGALGRLREWAVAENDVLVVYGDLLLDERLGPMVEQHRRTGASATILLHQRPNSNSLIRMEEDRRISAFIERPDEAQRAATPYPWVNSGVYLVHRRLLDRIPPDTPMDFPRDLFAPLADTEPLYGYPLQGYRCAIDSPQRYQAADRAVREGAYRPPRDPQLPRT